MTWILPKIKDGCTQTIHFCKIANRSGCVRWMGLDSGEYFRRPIWFIQLHQIVYNPIMYCDNIALFGYRPTIIIKMPNLRKCLQYNLQKTVARFLPWHQIYFDCPGPMNWICAGRCLIEIVDPSRGSWKRTKAWTPSLSWSEKPAKTMLNDTRAEPSIRVVW